MTTVPTATRSSRPGWRDPRLMLGVAVVALSVLLGGWLMARVDDTVGVWSVARDLPVGSTPTQSDLLVRRVRFADAEVAERYFASTAGLPAGVTVAREVTAGELLPRDALTTEDSEPAVEVPLSVLSDDLPATVRVGSSVDVWVVPKEGNAPSPRARLVLEGVRVVKLPGAANSLAPSSTRQVIVAAPRSDERGTDLSGAIGALASGHVVLTRKG